MSAKLLCVAALLALAAASASASSRFVLDEIDGLPARELLQAKPNCTRVHPACTACRNQRIPGTRRSELVCSTCAAGYRLRQDRTGKNCGESFSPARGARAGRAWPG